MIPADLVQDAMERYGVPGVAVGVVAGDDEVVAGFGVTSVEQPLDVDGDTLFQIGSISKTFTAAAVMRLAELGRLDLDEPVRTYVPELRLADESVAAAVTLRHLLAHTGGWAGDYFDATHRGDDALADIVARLAQLEQLTPLGDVWAYNNAGFYIAGRAVEAVTGEPFEVALRRLVLDPVGMAHAYFLPEDVVTHRFAVGHHRTGGVARPWALPRSAAPVGGLITSVRELLRYAREHWVPGRVLSTESLAALRQPQAAVGRIAGKGDPFFGDAVGLSWFVFQLDGHGFVTHSGGTNGQAARLVIAPEDRFILAVLTNHDSGSAVSNELQTQVIRDILGVTPPHVHRLELAPDELRAYAGRYVSPLTTADLSVTDGALVLQVTDNGGFPSHDSPPRPSGVATQLAFESADSVVACTPPGGGERGEFLRDPAGEIEWLRLRGRLHRRVDDGATDGGAGRR